MSPHSSQNTQPLNPKVVLAIGAHADDMEFWAGGTCATWAEAGAEVHLLVLTNGNKGTANPFLSHARLTDIREDEQDAAAKILGLTSVQFAGFDDCELKYSPREALFEVVRAIRKLKPDVVIGWDPSFFYWTDPQLPSAMHNHLDHRAAGEATFDAVYPIARDLTYPELGQPHTVRTLLMINPNQTNYAVDINAQRDTKLNAIAAHGSQNLDGELPVLERLHALGGGGTITESFVRLDYS